MDDQSLYFAIRTIGMSRTGGRKPSTLPQALRHNHREIQAELGANGHINPRRTTHNQVLIGGKSSTEDMDSARAFWDAVGFEAKRKDHVQAVEAVFSLNGAEVPGYFENCLQWLSEAFKAHILSAIIHRDEEHPHMHVLMLPFVDGVYMGGSLNDRAKTHKLRESFFRKVAGPAGLKRQGGRLRGQSKQWAIAAVLKRCQVMRLPDASGPLWPFFEAAIRTDPTRPLLALGIDPNTIRPSETVETNPIGIAQADSNPIGIALQGEKHQSLSCVGIAVPKPSRSSKPSTARRISATRRHRNLAAWLASLSLGGKEPKAPSNATKGARLLIARQAQQQAIARHAPVIQIQSADVGEVVRVREIHAIEAWADM